MDTVSIDPRKLHSRIGSPLARFDYVPTQRVFDEACGLYAWCRSQCEGDHETNVSA